ncbi:ferredoxin [Petropleomorpha daqingensis]|uniref:Ferredoxin n=1 Tax=Petropleomorpha daqingensis TaxID=2026353 RepID=A0A853C9C5_9ACTN|nr:ferredoxin [Petropleomorpha daqingensis]
MRVEVDRDRCASTGGCEAMAPDVFEVGDDGELVVLTAEPDDALLPDVRNAVQACPTRALRLVD